MLQGANPFLLSPERALAPAWLCGDPPACFVMPLAEVARAASNLPPPSAHHMEAPRAGSILPGVRTPLPTTRLPQVKSVTPAAPTRLCFCPAGTACSTPQPSAGENGGGRRPWHQVPIPGEGHPAPAQRALPNAAESAGVCRDAGRRGRGGGVKQPAGKPSAGRSQLGFSSASGLFRFPISVSPMCGRGRRCWMRSFVKCVQISC